MHRSLTGPGRGRIAGISGLASPAAPAALAALATGILLVGACSSAPAPSPAPAAVAATGSQQAGPVTPQDARAAATELFTRGKAHALSGETDCARAEFDLALETFRRSARPGDADDLEFSRQLYESVQAYVALLDGRAGEERPDVEASADALIAPAPTASPEEIATVGREVADSKLTTGFDIPITVNEQVLKAVAFYQFRTPQAFAGALKRSGRYLPLMRQILREQGLPQDLVYVAMIESAFKPGAHSRAAAHGFWQFIDGTAKRYGLKRTRYLDERSDPVKSTLAAAAYFRDLYEMFGDWQLAMAGYSTGEGRVLRALQRTGARDYWGLVAQNQLHPETVAYVPFVTAAALISRDPARFGFDVEPDPPLAFDVVSVGRPVDIGRVAEAVGTDLEGMRLLNSELRTRGTPRDVIPYPLRVPAGSGPRLVASLDSLPAAAEVEDRKVKVKKGDTVAKVAARNHVSVAELCDANDLAPTARLRPGSTLVVPVAVKARAAAKKGTRGGQAVLVSSANAGKAGTNDRPELTTAAEAIAAAGATAAGGSSSNPGSGTIRALPTPAAAVTRAEDVLSPSVAASGTVRPAPVAQPLPPRPQPNRYEIPEGGFTAEPAVRKASSSGGTKSATGIKSAKARYTVRRGDTLFRIAEQHGTTVEVLRKENGLSRHDPLKVGLRLKIPAASSPGR